MIIIWIYNNYKYNNCEKYGLKLSEKWYEHTPKSVVENE